MMPDVKDHTLLILGLGRSGCAAGALLRRHGARTIGADDGDESAVQRRWSREDLDELAGTAFDELKVGGSWQDLDPTSMDAVVLSPGVPPTIPALQRLRQAGIPVHGELEWASRFLAGRSIAVTGTNGKSTTTAWLAHILTTMGITSPAVGNLGTPLAAVADTLGPEAIPVVECSSFQLETIDTWRPSVGLVLNLAPDHLDRYPDLAGYYEAKARLATKVHTDGAFVTWTQCPEALQWKHTGQRILFGDREAGARSWIADEAIWISKEGRDHRLVSLADIALQSPPNLLNAVAAAAAVQPLVDDLDALAEGLRSFRGLSYRHQLVGRLNNVRFVDDTKATNVHAVCAGLDGYPTPVVLIVGGRGKGEDYTPLRAVMGSVRHVVTIGEEGPAIAQALQGIVPCHAAPGMKEAVTLAADLAAPDATVLLSPACASFDMFASYRERGLAFTAAARSLGAQED